MPKSDPAPYLCSICLRYLLRLRLGAVAGQTFAYGWVGAVLDLPLAVWPLISLGVALLGYTVWVMWRPGAVPGYGHCSLLREAVIDLASLTIALYLTGGSQNPLVILLLLPVTVAAATLQPRLIWAVTGTAIASYTALMVLHRDFPVPHHGSTGFELHVQGMWYGFILSAVLIGYFVAQMGAALRALDRQLAQAREEALVESSPTGIFLLREGRLSLVNPRLAELFDCDRDELIGVEVLSLVHPDDRERVGIAIREGHSHPGPDSEVECRLIARSGLTRWVALRHTRIASRGEALTLGTVQDLTDRKRMEQALRSLSAQLLTVQEEERGRVARDLHDGPCQTLTAARLILENFLGDQPLTERRASMQALRSLVPAIHDAADELRRISTDLRPAMLDDLGLSATVRWHLANLAKLHPTLQIRHRLEVAEADIPPTLKTPIFRILQEASNNAAKHSRGTVLDVRLSAEDGWLRLAVRDDGVGFDTSPVLADPADTIRPGLGHELHARARRTLRRGAPSPDDARAGHDRRGTLAIRHLGSAGDHTLLDGVGGQTRDIGDTELAHQARPVLLHGFLADAQVLADLAAAVSLCHQFQDLPLAPGEQVVGAILGVGLLAVQAAQDEFGGDRFAEIPFPARRAPHTDRQLRRAGVLAQVRVRPGPDGAENVLFVLMDREDHHPRPGRDPLDLSERLQAIHPWHG